MGKKTNGTGACDNQTLTLSFVEISFGRLYNLYKRWSWIDPYYSVAFIYGVLVTSSINFLVAIVFYITGNQSLNFNLIPHGVILFILVEVIFYYFYKNKELYTESIKNLPKEFSKKDYMAMAIVFLMFSTWFLGPIIYKWGNNIH